ncbi:MAG: lantibiotic dehydratase family protein, partial [Verrucomicrobiaceae bacterium]|nr:lantibiotic dehydratase family protein [Verrucomicrobiaceae bacterium]
MSSYRLAPVFLVRAAGVPFDHLEKLATRRTAASAREALVRQDKPEQARAAVESVLRAELDEARAALLASSHAVLPPYLVFGAGQFRERLSDLKPDAPLPSRNARIRERERHLLLYLQRVCSKNDTFSRFGPSAWGRIGANAALTLEKDAPISARDHFFERWVAHVVAAALNADPESRLEIAPRLNPNGRLEKTAFFFAQTNERLLLDLETVEALRRCDGNTPAHALEVPDEKLERLARLHVLRWEVETPGMQPYAFDLIVDQVRRWRDGAARARWLQRLEPLAALREKFAAAEEVAARSQIMAEARQQINALGVEHQTSSRHLYAAANPIAEECARGGEIALGSELAEQFVRDAEPWIDLWRDTYAFVASRVAAGLRRFFESAPRQNDSLPLSAFLRHCALNGMPLTGHGCVVLAHGAFREVKAAFRKRIEDRADEPELELTREDCHLVRNTFDYPRFDEYTYPSADLQISAVSLGAIARGDYEWVLAELHPPAALMHHCFFWSCPDQPVLSRALASTTFGQPNFHFGFAAADFTAHTTVRIFEA